MHFSLWCIEKLVNDGQKRRRLEAAGQENCSPKPSSSRRLAELDVKPDTPMVPSVRSRVQQLTQRPEGKMGLTVEGGMGSVECNGDICMNYDVD